MIVQATEGTTFRIPLLPRNQTTYVMAIERKTGKNVFLCNRRDRFLNVLLHVDAIIVVENVSLNEMLRKIT